MFLEAGDFVKIEPLHTRRSLGRKERPSRFPIEQQMLTDIAGEWKMDGILEPEQFSGLQPSATA